MRGQDRSIPGWQLINKPGIRHIHPLHRLPAFAFAISMPLLALIPIAQAQDLSTTVRAALARAPAFASAEARLNAARQRQSAARGAYLPSIDASAGHYHIDNQYTSTTPTNSQYDSNEASISLTQKLFDQGRHAALKAARAELERATAEYEDARQALLVRVADRYFGVLLAEDTLALAEAERKAVARQRDVARARLKVGLGTITEVHDAEARYQLSQAQLLEADNRLADAKAALEEITGEHPRSLIRPETPIDMGPLEPASVEDWIRIALDKNPGLRAAAAQLADARAQLNASRAGHLPQLDLVARRSYSSGTQATSGLPFTQHRSVLGLELRLPIYQGGRISHQSRAAAFELEATQQALHGQRRATTRTIRSAYLTVSSGMARINALHLAVVASQSALAAKETGFRAGINTNLDVLNAQRDLYRTRRDYAEARYTYLIDLLRLKHAAGILTEKDLNEINARLSAKATPPKP